MDFEERFKLVDAALARRIADINAAAADAIVAATRDAIVEREALFRHQIAAEIARPKLAEPVGVTRTDGRSGQGMRGQAPAAPGDETSATTTDNTGAESASDLTLRILRAAGTAMLGSAIDEAAAHAGKSKTACEKARQRLRARGVIENTPEGWVIAGSRE